MLEPRLFRTGSPFDFDRKRLEPRELPWQGHHRLQFASMSRIASGLFGFGTINGLVHQVVGWLSGTAAIIPSSLSRCSPFSAFWAKL